MDQRREANIDVSSTKLLDKVKKACVCFSARMEEMQQRHLEDFRAPRPAHGPPPQGTILNPNAHKEIPTVCCILHTQRKQLAQTP